MNDASAKDSPRTIVQLRGLRKVFLTETVETRALWDVSLHIDRGDYLLIQGPSGCGKSTLLSIMGLLEEPTAGEYLLNNRDTAQLSLTERAHLRNRELGFLFQSYNLIADLTVLGNVALPLRYRKETTKSERRARAMHLLEDVGIAHRAEHYPAQLSGGQQQRAALARALVGTPSLLLADEPTGNLDAVAEHAVMQLLAERHAKGTTVCVVSHNPAYAGVANRRLMLSEGRLVSESTG